MINSDTVIVLVPKKGANLPVGECILVKDTTEAYIVKAAAKSGRGRGVKTVLRQYVIPKSEVAYLYQEREVAPEEAAKYPSSNGTKPHTYAAPAKKAEKRSPGRPKGTKAAAAPAASADAAPVKRGRGRPKGTKAAAAPAASTDAAPVKRGRGRPKGPKAAAAPAASTEGAPAKRGRGRPKGTKAAAAPAAPAVQAGVEGAPVKRGRGRPKGTKVAAPVDSTTEAASPPVTVAAPAADPPAKKGGSSLFTDFGA